MSRIVRRQDDFAVLETADDEPIAKSAKKVLELFASLAFKRLAPRTCLKEVRGQSTALKDRGSVSPGGKELSIKPVVQMFPVGMLETNCVIAMCPDTREAIVVDPGGDADRIMKVVEKMNAVVKYIVDTHGHPDHVLANHEIKARTGAKLAIHPLDAPMLQSASPELTFWLTTPYHPAQPDVLVDEGDKITIGNVVFDVLHTPGHTPGHISLVTDEIAIVGDVLFFQSIGRTDFPGGSFEQLAESIRSKLFTLGDATIVYPGHGPATKIGDEKKHNPFVGENAYY